MTWKTSTQRLLGLSLTRLGLLRLCGLLVVGAALPVGAAAPAASSDFDKAVAPFLAEHCNRCHDEKKHKGEFRVTNTTNDTVIAATAEDNLRTWDQINDRKRGTLLEAKEVPALPGSSGLQVKFKSELLIEGFRPKRIIRLWPSAWKIDDLPREERLYQ